MAVLGAEGIQMTQLRLFKVRALSLLSARASCAARGKHVSPAGRRTYINGGFSRPFLPRVFLC